MPHYDQINVPCNVTTSATDHKYGGAELCYETETRWEHGRKISHLCTVILILTPFIHWCFVPRYSLVMQMHLTINKLEKACMFPWIKFFLFLRDNSFWSKLSARRLTACCVCCACIALGPSRHRCSHNLTMMANKRGNHALCDHVSKYFMEMNIFKENLECWDCDPGIMEIGE